MTFDDKQRDRLSIVLSFRNEEKVIPELIRRLSAALAQCNADYELIFVNDDSTDRSLELLKAQVAADRRVKVITMSRRFGVVECLLAGIERTQGNAVIYLDCDLQDPPELIPELVGEWRKGADVVYTVRTRRIRESRLKILITRLAYRIITALSEISLPVEAGDFRLLSRRVVNELLRLRESDPYMRGLTTWVGFRQVPVLYERQPRFAGKGHFPLLSANPVKAFLAGITSFSIVPLYLILLLGLAGVALAAAGLAATAVAALLGAAATGAALTFFFVLLWAVLMTALGVVGLYVSRIYRDVRGRPRYIVADTIGFD
ncbi:MAG: glycosyltransferase family 2 protein [Alphaproteobacteria bacterium]